MKTIKTILAASAFLFAANASGALAAEDFTALEGVPAEALSNTEMAAVQGEHIIINLVVPRGDPISMEVGDDAFHAEIDLTVFPLALSIQFGH